MCGITINLFNNLNREKLKNIVIKLSLLCILKRLLKVVAEPTYCLRQLLQVIKKITLL